MPRAMLRKKPFSTALLPDLSWRENSQQNYTMTKPSAQPLAAPGGRVLVLHSKVKNLNK